MPSAVSVCRGGVQLQPSHGWLHKKTVANSRCFMLNKVNTAFTPLSLPGPLPNSCCFGRANHFVASNSTHSRPARRLLSPSLRAQIATPTDTEAPLVPVRHTPSTGHIISPTFPRIFPFNASLTRVSPLPSSAVSWHRLFASKMPPSSSPVPASPPATKEQLIDQPGEHETSHEAEKRHGDELKNYYHMPSDHHGDPRHHINPDGTLKFQTTAESFHWENDGAATPAQQIVSVNGKKMIKGVETRDFVELFQIYQKNMPFWPRMRMSTWGNHDLLMKAEFLFFWVPTFIIWSLAVPMFTMLYMSDEAIYASMTVKVIGRQWYWIYEVESPVDEDE